MVLPFWGQLEKAQDDDKVIDTTIAEAITAHEADATAHLGSGESLEAHKTEEVIDHPAGAVLADKNTMTEVLLRDNWKNTDGWAVVGTAVVDGFGTLIINIEESSPPTSGIVASPLVPVNFLNSSFNMLYQLFGRFTIDNDDFDATFGFLGIPDATIFGFGFVIEGGVLYGHARNNTEQNRTDAISIDLEVDHIYRCYLDSATQKITFTIDGVEVGQVDVPTNGFETDVSIRIRLTSNGLGIVNFFVGEIFVSRAL